MNTFRGRGLVIAAVLLCTLYLGYRFYGGQLEAAALEEHTLERAIPTVAITQARPADANDTITLPGNIQAWYEAQIYAQVSGYVRMWHKDYGAQVKQGDVLAEINAPALDAQYSQAKADLETERAKNVLTELTAKRYVAMRHNQAVSEQAISVQVQEAKAQAARMRAAEQNVR
ncbi:MAG: biotin/lipoyl-binding protein, partial [Nitrospira sp.]|nr:biotin/lipoyl-binding protein [Nitrospira sp.]